MHWLALNNPAPRNIPLEYPSFVLLFGQKQLVLTALLKIGCVWIYMCVNSEGNITIFTFVYPLHTVLQYHTVGQDCFTNTQTNAHIHTSFEDLKLCTLNFPWQYHSFHVSHNYALNELY